MRYSRNEMLPILFHRDIKAMPHRHPKMCLFCVLFLWERAEERKILHKGRNRYSLNQETATRKGCLLADVQADQYRNSRV